MLRSAVSVHGRLRRTNSSRGRGAGTILVSLALLGAVVAFSAAQPAPQPVAEELRGAVETAAAAVTPSLVRIHVVEADYWSGRETKSEAVGSGVIFTPEGHVITNHHVAGNAKQLLCTMADKEEIDAELVGTDPLTDISVLKLRPDKPRQFPAAKFGDSSKVKVGDYVLALGSPLALSQSVTLGIVSNTAMVMPDIFWPFKFEVDGEDVGSIVRWIGHDAALAGGDSGGALVNLDGEVIGINEMAFGLGGAIPSNLAREVAEQLMRDGKAVRAWIGLDVQPLLKSQADTEGVLVGGTIPGSPAEKAGLRSGDVLVSVGGEKVAVHVPEELPLFNQVIAGLPIGKPVEAVVLRDGKSVTLQMVAVERETVKPKPRELAEWGITARNLSLLAAKELKRESREGVLVTSVRPGGPCDEAKPKIVDGDIIVDVAGTPMRSIEDLAAITKTITEGKTERAPVLVTYDRRTEKLLTVVKVGKDKVPEPDRELQKAWLPVTTQVLTREMAEALGFPDKTGVRITQVYPNSAAEQAGLKVGDIITAMDGEEIPASRAEHFEVFPTMIRQRKIGSEVELTVIRGKEEQKVKATLAASQPAAREMKRYRNDDFEFSARALAFEDRVRQKLSEEQPGAYVDGVTEGGWAALAHLAVGDLILAVEGQPTADVAALEQAMKRVSETKPNSVVFWVKRGIHELYVELKPKWAKGE